MASQMPKGGALPGLCAAAVAILAMIAPVLQAPATAEDPAAVTCLDKTGAAAEWLPAGHPRIAGTKHRGPAATRACSQCHAASAHGGPEMTPPSGLSLDDLRAIADHTTPRQR